ncbi:hypothetical protein HMPREF1573_01239, partial [Gardnerella vaginalis JCP7276]
AAVMFVMIMIRVMTIGMIETIEAIVLTVMRIVLPEGMIAGIIVTITTILKIVLADALHVKIVMMIGMIAGIIVMIAMKIGLLIAMPIVVETTVIHVTQLMTITMMSIAHLAKSVLSALVVGSVAILTHLTRINLKSNR